jgi:hypothetical protein
MYASKLERERWGAVGGPGVDYVLQAKPWVTAESIDIAGKFAQFLAFMAWNRAILVVTKAFLIPKLWGISLLVPIPCTDNNAIKCGPCAPIKEVHAWAVSRSAASPNQNS